MDWMQQSLEMMKSWSDMQKKMWEDWAGAASSVSKTEDSPLGDWVARWQETMQTSMAVWEDLTRKMVESESTWVGSEAAAFWPGREEDMKKMAKVWMDQTAAMMKSWTEAQKTLWDTWFSVANSLAKPAQGPGGEWFDGWQATARKSMESWEELARKTMDTQADWLTGWMKTTEQASGKKTATGTSEQEN